MPRPHRDRPGHKVFGRGASAVHAFGPVDLDIEAGEFVSLLGPSGCGKSTLMLMIAGLLERSTGTISVDAARWYRRRRPISASCSRTTRWCPGARCAAMSSCSSNCAGCSTSSVHADRVIELLAPVHLDDFADRYPHRTVGRHAAAGRLLPGDGPRSQDHAVSTSRWASSTP